MTVHQSMIAIPALPGHSILRLGQHHVFCAQRVKSPILVHPFAADALLDHMPLLLEKQIVLFAQQGITVTLLEQTRPTRVLRVQRDHTALQAPLLACSVHPVTTAVNFVPRPARHVPLEPLQSIQERQQPILAKTALWVISAPLQALQYAVRVLPERSATNREPRRLGCPAL
jgi:hypothetical protein